MPIRACPDCGSDRLAWPTGTKAAPVQPVAYTCWSCRWQGTPLEFASFGEWQAFRSARPARPVLHAP